MRVQRFWRPCVGILRSGCSSVSLAWLAAQSCSLCYTQAASSTQRFIAALRSGIIILIIPPMFMSIGITVLAYRKRNQFKDGSDILPESRSR